MAATSPEPWVPPDTFAHRLVALRRELGMTVEEIARECDIKSPTWSTWENGRLPHDLAGVVQKIHEGTGVDRDWLLWGFHNKRNINLSIVPPIPGQQELPGMSPRAALMSV